MDVGRLSEGLTGRYEVEREIGHGGMATVYLARDLKHDRPVAIKVLRPELASMVGSDRFGLEIEVTARLNHPHILPLLDSGDANGLLYYVTPFVEGESLRDRLRREKQLPVDEALRITGEVADALSYAHSYGILHRDIKPENILLESGHAVVADFGIARVVGTVNGARLTDSGFAIGTPAYMSPEQAGGETDLDSRSDMYSLGCVLYECLAGEPPFTGRTAQAIIAQVLSAPPPPIAIVRPAIPDPVVAAIERALEKVPADRFVTLGEFRVALSAPTGSRRVLARTSRRRQALVGIASLAIVGAAAYARHIITSDGPAALDPSRVVVFPAAATDPVLAQAGVGWEVALAIEQAMEHTRPLKWIDGWSRLSESQRIDARRVTPAVAREISVDRGAGHYIEGVLRSGSAERAVVLRLFDVAGDSVVAQETARGPPDADVASLALAAVGPLLPLMLEPGRAVDLAPLTDRAPGAVALSIQGDREYRASRFDAALEFYRRAVEEDSLLAFAAVKGAQAASWRGRFEEAEQLIGVALSRDSLLPEKHRWFARGLASYLQGEADTAIAWLQRAAAADPEWSEAHMALGEVMYHILPSGPARLDSLARTEFEAAARLDDGFTPPLVHLSEYAIREGHRALARTLMSRLRQFTPDSTVVDHLAVMMECLERGGPVVGWDVAAAVRPRDVLFAAKALAAGGANPGCSERAFRALLGAGAVGLEYRWGAFLGLQGLLAAQDRIDELVALVDSTVKAHTGQAMALYVLDVLANVPVDEEADSVMRFLQTVFGADYASLDDPATLWLAGAWHARRGDVEVVRSFWRRAAAIADSSSDPALHTYERALAGHAALVVGDTAGAIEIFRSMSLVASRDIVEWNLWRPHAPERLLLARLLLARGEYRAARDAAAMLSHPAPIVYLPYLRASLEVQRDAARGLKDRLLEAHYDDRIAQLDRVRAQ